MRCSRADFRAPAVLLATCLYCFTAALVGAQEVSGGPSSPSCLAADVDVTLEVTDARDHSHTVSLTLRNISDEVCSLQGAAPLPSFNARGTSLNLPLGTCFHCSADGVSQTASSIALRPGASARQVFRWRTRPLDSQAGCGAPEWMNTFVNQDPHHPILLVSRRLLPDICSVVQVSAYELDAPSSEESITKGDGEHGLNIRLTSDKPVYVEGPGILAEGSSVVGESITLHLAFDAETAPLPGERPICPDLIQRTRSPDGSTRFDEMPTEHACTVTPSPAGSAPQQLRMNLDAGHLGRWSGLGKHQISFLRIQNSGGLWHLADSSNPLTLEIVDVSTLKRQWGPLKRGVGVSATLDKTTYEFGEDIPVHVALQNFSAEIPIYGNSPTWRPCSTVQIAIVDQDGQPVKAFRNFGFGPCMEGGPSGLWRYPKGVAVPLELSLKAKGLLPDGPGRFAVTVTWSPYAGTDDTCTLCELPADFDFDNHYATVNSQPAAFVVEEKANQSLPTEPPR